MTIQNEIRERDGLIGVSVKRREDAALLAGRGRFCDDINAAGMTFGHVIRSPHAHAKIRAVHTAPARERPGVVAVFIADDLARNGVTPIIPNWLVGDITVPMRTVLATDRVRFIGDPIAFIVAESREAAVDAAEHLVVEYEELPAVVDEELAFAEGAIKLHDNIERNRVGIYDLGGGNVEQAFADAEHTIAIRLVNNRLIPSPIEPRTVVAQFDPYADKLTVHIGSQVPHMHRRWIAETMGFPEHSLQIISPDVGGGFGAKMHFYPEEVLVPFTARLLKRPVKWTETRSESHVSTTHGRGHIDYVEAAFTNEGKITALKVKSFANMGAYLSNMATGIPTINFATFVTGCYKIPNLEATINLMLTNTVPIDAYRGAGRPEAAYVIERTLDAIATAIGCSPVKVRELNLVQPQDFPYAPYGHPLMIFDSGNYQRTFADACQRIGYEAIKRAQPEQRARGIYRGVAVTNYNEICGVGRSPVMSMVGFNRGGWESACIRVHSDGKVTLLSGSMPTGNGHATTYAQIVASELQLPIEDVDVAFGDTDRVPMGNGSYNSRSIVVGGTAAVHCARKILSKARRFAAAWLECNGEEAVIYADGQFMTLSGESVSFREVARLAHLSHMRPDDDQPGLDETVFYDPAAMSAPHGSHAVHVEVDVETGAIRILDYVASDDAGVILNPLLAEGQVHGGVAQGIGQALYECAEYNEQGQCLAGSLLDYALPRSDQLPPVRSAFFESPSPIHPLGAKGVGEAGTCAAPPAVVAAVCDALSPFGITHIDMPLTPPRVWAAISAAKANMREMQ